MGEFFFGIVFCFVIVMAVVPNIDENAHEVKKLIVYGESVCSDFGGLKSFDRKNHYTCNNNLVITGDNHE